MHNYDIFWNLMNFSSLFFYVNLVYLLFILVAIDSNLIKIRSLICPDKFDVTILTLHWIVRADHGLSDWILVHNFIVHYFSLIFKVACPWFPPSLSNSTQRITVDVYRTYIYRIRDHCASPRTPSGDSTSALALTRNKPSKLNEQSRI